jgi:hypothetical protein
MKKAAFAIVTFLVAFLTMGVAFAAPTSPGPDLDYVAGSITVSGPTGSTDDSACPGADGVSHQYSEEVDHLRGTSTDLSSAAGTDEEHTLGSSATSGPHGTRGVVFLQKPYFAFSGKFGALYTASLQIYPGAGPGGAHPARWNAKITGVSSTISFSGGPNHDQVESQGRGLMVGHYQTYKRRVHKYVNTPFALYANVEFDVLAGSTTPSAEHAKTTVGFGDPNTDPFLNPPDATSPPPAYSYPDRAIETNFPGQHC